MFRIIEKVKQWLNQGEQEKKEELAFELSQEQKTSVPLASKEQSASNLKINKPSLKPTRETFQEKLDSLEDGATLQLSPPGGEYAGPVTIARPLTLDGQGATIWAIAGPVVSIQSDRVSLRNLRIEVTGENAAFAAVGNCAILVKSGQMLELDNVEVRGEVMGLPEEEGEWKYPEALHLGQLAPGREYDFRLRIVVPVACKIATNISGLEVKPSNLTPGANEIQLHLEQLPKDILINGSIFLVSPSLKRRLTLTAHVLSNRDEQLSPSQNSLVWEPENWSSFLSPKVESLPAETESIKESIKIVSQETPTTKQPDRVSIPPNRSSSSKIRYEHSQPINNPLFQQTSTPSQPVKSDKDSAAASKERSIPIDNPLFQQTSTPSQPVNNSGNISASSLTGVSSQPLNPLFQQTPAPSKPSDLPEQGTQQQSSLNSASIGGSKLPKRKIVCSNDVSPLFGNGVSDKQDKHT